MPLKIQDVYEIVEESESDELFFDADTVVDTTGVYDFIIKLQEKHSPLHILKVNRESLFLWKDIEGEDALRSSAILTIINLLLPQFRITDYVLYA